MTDTNCNDETTNILVKSPKLLDKAELNLDILEKVKKSAFVGLFRKEGVPVGSLMSFNCKVKPDLYELRPKSQFAQNLRASINCNSSGIVLNLGGRF